MIPPLILLREFVQEHEGWTIQEMPTIGGSEAQVNIHGPHGMVLFHGRGPTIDAAAGVLYQALSIWTAHDNRKAAG